MSPGQRREMTYDQAVEFCNTDVLVDHSPQEPVAEEPVIYS